MSLPDFRTINNRSPLRMAIIISLIRDECHSVMVDFLGQLARWVAGHPGMGILQGCQGSRCWTFKKHRPFFFRDDMIGYVLRKNKPNLFETDSLLGGL